MTTSTLDFEAPESCGESQNLQGERSRFITILRRHSRATGLKRRSTRETLVEYLRCSPQSHRLVDHLINHCVDMKSEDRLDIAIDILSQLPSIYEYAYQFLIDDIRKWPYVFQRAYEPNDDYWYIMLRSVARGNAEEAKKIKLVVMAADATSRGVLEAVVESLGDIGTTKAIERLAKFFDHNDKFIANLARTVATDASQD